MFEMFETAGYSCDKIFKMEVKASILGKAYWNNFLNIVKMLKWIKKCTFRLLLIYFSNFGLLRIEMLIAFKNSKLRF